MENMLLPHLLAIFAVFLCGDHGVEFAWGRYCGYPLEKLPDVLTPVDYEIELAPDLVENNYHGQVVISMYTGKLMKSRDQRLIIMHAGRHLAIGEVIVFKDHSRYMSRSNMEKLTVKDLCHDENFEILVIELHSNSAYDWRTGLIVQISFGGTTPTNGGGLVRLAYESPVGLHRFLYTRYSDRRIGARQLFPCFDQPIYRVTAQLTVSGVPLDQQVCSNTLIESSNVSRLDDATTNQLTKTFRFKPMESVSISQVSFAIGEFTATRINDHNGINIVNLIQTEGGMPDFSIRMLRDVDKLMQNFIGQPLPLNMLNVISLPGIGKKFETNKLGFMVVDSSMMSHEKQPELDEAFEIVGRMIKGLAQQWIGNSVECRYPSHVWFFEAISDWIVLHIMERTNTNDYRILYTRNQMMGALELDALPSSEPVCLLFTRPPEEANVPAHEQINPCVFDPNDETKRTKATSILNSLEDSCSGNFHEYIRNFLKEFHRQPADLIDFMERYWEVCDLRPHVAINKMQSLRGYPLLELSLNEVSDKLHMKQERFKLDYTSDEDDGENDSGEFWILPIKITYGNLSTGWSSSDKVIIRKSQLQVYSKNPEPNVSQKDKIRYHTDWVKVNKMIHGFYRVLYSDTMLSKLMEVDPVHLSNVDCLNLLDDALALFKAGKVGAYYLIQTLLGVSKQLDDLIHDLMAISYKELRRLFLHSPMVNHKIERLAIHLFEYHYLRNEFKETNLRFKQDIEARGNYYEVLAMIGYDRLTEKALESFEDESMWNINPNLHTSIFIAVTRNGDDADVAVLLSILDYPNRGNDQFYIKIVRAMGLARDYDRLQIFWDKIVSSKQHLISHFIISMLDSIEGDHFVREVVLPQLPAFTRAELGLEPEQMRDFFLEVCSRLSNAAPCEAPLRVFLADSHEQLAEINIEILLAKRKIYSRQALDSNKLTFSFLNKSIHDHYFYVSN